MRAVLNSKIARTVGVTIFGALLIAVAVWLSAEDFRELEDAAARAPARAADPLTVELVRCNGLGSAALDDADCRAAWAENRRRFFLAPATQRPSVDPVRAQSTPQTSGAR